MANNITIPLTGSYKDYLTNKFHASFSFKSVNKLDIHRIINNLSSKNSSGHDEISSVLLKKLGNILSSPITTIINQSLKSGIFPDNLKIAKISPIFKKGDHHQIENYRPISLLPTISKIFEKVVFIQLYDFFSENNFLYPSQYGFRKKHSTELAALETVDILLNKLDNKQTPAAIFIDLSKAFDTIDHQILLNKLSYYGIKNTALKWFTNYLFARSQYVEINSQKSSKIKISTGIPQGSILGPLLFIIYINDFIKCSDLFKFILYADDTTLITPNLSEKNVNHVNHELNKISNWLAHNKLSLNVKKTKFIHFHNINKTIPNNIVLRINNTTIEKTDSFDFLGLTLNENFKWKSHVNKVANKTARYIGVLNKLKTYVPKNILKTIYNSLFYLISHMVFWLGVFQLHVSLNCRNGRLD